MPIPANSIIEDFREVCKQILCSSLSESACEAALFFLRRGLGRDPFEVFWDNPGVFYRELEKVFGVGARVLIRLLVSRINNEFSLNMNPQRFLELMQRGDQQSIDEIRSFIAKVSELYRGRR